MAVAGEITIRFQQLGSVVHPGKKRFLTLFEALCGAFASYNALRIGVRPDFCAQGFEYLQTVVMVSMVVTHNDAFDGLLSNFPDQAHQLVG